MVAWSSCVWWGVWGGWNGVWGLPILSCLMTSTSPMHKHTPA